MTNEEHIEQLKKLRSFHNGSYGRSINMAIEALKQEPCREIEDYENEIEDLHNRLDIAEYDKERLREEVTNLEEKIIALEQEPCTDAVSRQAVQEANTISIELKENPHQMWQRIQNLPSVTPTRPKGDWVACWLGGKIEYYRCSECDGRSDEELDFCQSCFADMRGNG